MNTCNRIENDACRGCNVLAMLWKRITPENRAQVDEEAATISRTYCPTGSGGIDAEVRATVYNYRIPNETLLSIW